MAVSCISTDISRKILNLTFCLEHDKQEPEHRPGAVYEHMQLVHATNVDAVSYYSILHAFWLGHVSHFRPNMSS